ncbi:hypothetical protein GUJ93_ZPchr0013g36765 [Zizania palustris]|uniref:Uncharacterized protein n=1 Tax=Zizania palustris TaxID=103762 RepID=A0A8J6BTC6_ZIZPA|nr:hypothetical protein GUJ93_ZPchr0013g36765 [Zizania palustris]
MLVPEGDEVPIIGVLSSIDAGAMVVMLTSDSCSSGLVVTSNVVGMGTLLVVLTLDVGLLGLMGMPNVIDMVARAPDKSSSGPTTALAALAMMIVPPMDVLPTTDPIGGCNSSRSTVSGADGVGRCGNSPRLDDVKCDEEECWHLIRLRLVVDVSRPQALLFLYLLNNYN